MALWLVNPGRKRRHMAKTKRRPSKKQLAARRKFAAMARARAKAARRVRSPKRRVRRRAVTRRAITHRRVGMARKRRRAAPKRRRRTSAPRRMRSVRRAGGAAVSRQAWRASGFRRNPRRRRRYRRNPGFSARGIVGQVKDLGIGAGVGLLGMAAGRTISNMIPFGQGDPIMGFAKSTAVAIGIRIFGAKVLGNDLARIAAIGAMLNPTKDLLISFVPQAQQFLGASTGVMYLPSFPTSRSIASYAGASGGEVSDGEELGSYANGEVWQ